MNLKYAFLALIAALCLAGAVVYNTVAAKDQMGRPKVGETLTRLRILSQLSCRGSGSQVEAYRDVQGAISRYVHHGDRVACPNAPLTIFDEKGTLLRVLPEADAPSAVRNVPENQLAFWVRGLLPAETF